MWGQREGQTEAIVAGMDFIPQSKTGSQVPSGRGSKRDSSI